ncbi:MAG: GNAT family N-acetyltransferase [Pseudomonadota bacterium]
MTPIRKAADSLDLEAIHALLHRSFAYMEGRIDPPSSLHDLTVAGIAEACDPGGVWAIGAPPVACVFLSEKRGRLYLGKLAVDPAHRGQGLAGVLIRLAEERALARGLRLLELQTRIELVENHATFARLGFVKTAEDAHEGYDRPTGIVMQKRL